MADLQIPSLATLGNISRTFAELRVLRQESRARHERGRARERSLDVRARRGRVGPAARSVRAQPDLRRPGSPPAERLSQSVPGVAGPGEGSHVAVGRGTPRRSQRGAARCGAPRPGRAAEQRLRRVDSAQRGPRALREPNGRRLHHRRAMADPGRERRGHPVDRPAGVSHLSADREADSGPRRVGQSDCRGATTARRSRSRGRPTKPAAWRARSTSSSRAPRRWTNSAG